MDLVIVKHHLLQSPSYLIDQHHPRNLFEYFPVPHQTDLFFRKDYFLKKQKCLKNEKTKLVLKIFFSYHSLLFWNFFGPHFF